jgi:hypothetical protein
MYIYVYVDVDGHMYKIGRNIKKIRIIKNRKKFRL